MNDGATAKQKIVEKIKESSNILVTVSTDPSVDELSAALGLTLMLNKLNKHATAVVSGTIPSAISFLDPAKTFENTVDSLRDFIIALDKEKADHLRYKVEGDVVKIFVTPYRTTITEEDLDFSQGDYNVEFVLALGVKDEGHLDKALEAHGRILHDAAVATLTSGSDTSSLGSVAWHEASASSISEMLVALSEALKTDKPVLDEQSATAFLTGIVAATDRFSNNQTSSKVMTMAAQLMAAGANQQLIAAKLQESHEISGDPDTSSDQDSENKDGTTDLAEGATTKVERKSKKSNKSKQKETPVEDQKSDDGSLAISHQPEVTLDEVAKEVQQANNETATEKAEDALAEQLSGVAPAAAATSAAPTIEELRKDLASANAEVEEAAQQPDLSGQPPMATSLNASGMPDYEPTFGGTLNATTDQAADEKRREAEATQNHKILSHANNKMADSSAPTFPAAPFSASMASSSPVSMADAGLPPIAPEPTDQGLATHAEPVINPLPSQTEPATQDGGVHDQALADVHAAFTAGSAPATSTTDTNSTVPPAATPQLPPMPAGLPPLPDFSTLPPPPPLQGSAPAPVFQPTPDEQLGQVFDGASAPAAPSAPQQSNDPGQFQIPGQK